MATMLLGGLDGSPRRLGFSRKRKTQVPAQSSGWKASVQHNSLSVPPPPPSSVLSSETGSLLGDSHGQSSPYAVLNDRFWNLREKSLGTQIHDVTTFS